MSSPLAGTYLRFLFDGLLVTLVISSASLILGTLIGLVGGAARASSVRWLRTSAGVYVEIFRSIPLLIQLFLVFYGIPALTRISLDPFAAAIAGMSIYIGAYMTEIVRAGIEAVPRGQCEAAYALGFGYVRMMRYVRLPQALRVMVPPAVGLLIASIKDSSLASIIGLTELTRAGLAIRTLTFSNWDVLGLLALLYVVVCSSVAAIGYLIERRMHLTDAARRRNLSG